VPLVVCAAPLSCHAERLAGVSGDDGVDCTAHGAPVEGGDIIPDRGGCEVSSALGGNDPVSCRFIPFDIAARVGTRLGQHESHIKATGARAK